MMFVKNSPHCFMSGNLDDILGFRIRNNSIYYNSKQDWIIAIVPPDDNLFHQFHKDSEMCCMPCPGEIQLGLMGQLYRRFAIKLEYCTTDVEFHDHVNKFGPFSPTASYWSWDQKHEFEE